ncbi:hypothetical protein [Actinoalloteichus hymeniacidonis]|uniref:PPE family protein n=1 Tax=Actinoalloteichus hymeniacidonis TaxID=340345 RepID=A0AAC9HUI7_9PSEU|nr:hypothetical protein [Actinoalloteichus hymeniacidonis]AOS65982.1 hypothetical protein TL08_26065 [Actinoalloteichus hymeniacidonis]MBB5905916.1 hypothetical protein [Actinoalloteichus hymeniacidonis]
MTGTNWDGIGHQQLVDWFTGGSTDTATESAVRWREHIAGSFGQVSELIEGALRDSGAVWHGAAAESMRDGVSPLARFALDAQDASVRVGDGVQRWAEAFDHVKREMPAPIRITDDEAWRDRAVAALIGTVTDREENEGQARDAEERARDLARAYEAMVDETVGQLPFFAPVPLAAPGPGERSPGPGSSRPQQPAGSGGQAGPGAGARPVPPSSVPAPGPPGTGMRAPQPGSMSPEQFGRPPAGPAVPMGPPASGSRPPSVAPVPQAPMPQAATPQAPIPQPPQTPAPPAPALGPPAASAPQASSPQQTPAPVPHTPTTAPATPQAGTAQPPRPPQPTAPTAPPPPVRPIAPAPALAPAPNPTLAEQFGPSATRAAGSTGAGSGTGATSTGATGPNTPFQPSVLDRPAWGAGSAPRNTGAPRSSAGDDPEYLESVDEMWGDTGHAAPAVLGGDRRDER